MNAQKFTLIHFRQDLHGCSVTQDMGYNFSYSCENAQYLEIALNQGSPNFFVRGPHKLLLNSPRAT